MVISRTKIFLICLLIILILGFGTFGFHLIEGWSFIDSLFMTSITLTTVGFGEVHPLSDGGKLFTLVIIFFGAGIFTYSISILMSYMMSYDFDKRRREKMQKKIDTLKKHTVVCGFGRMGAVICHELSRNNNPFVVIEKRDDLVNELKKTNYLWIEGDAANDDCMELSGLERAKVLVSMIDNDSEALYISLAGRSINPDLHIIARGTDMTAKKRILKAGADKVVLPIVMSGLQVAESVLNPAVEDFLDLTGDNKSEKRIQLADLFVTKDSSLINESLHSKGHEMSDLIIVGIRKHDKSFVFKPESSYIFNEGDCLIAMGSREAYNRARKHFQLSTIN